MTRAQQLAAKKASSKQIAMLYAIAARAGLRGERALLEFIEYEAKLGLELASMEDLPGTLVDVIKRRLEQRRV